MAIGGHFEHLRSYSVLLSHVVMVHTFAYFTWWFIECWRR